MSKELSKKELKAIEDGKDKTSTDVNGKAKPITYKKGDGTPPSIIRERAKIKIPLDEKARLEKAEQLCKLLDEKADLEDKKRSVASKFAEDIQAKQTEIDIVQEQVAKKYEEKDVICDILRDFDKGVRVYQYKGVSYHTEPLTARDHHLDLDLAEENNKAQMEVVKDPKAAHIFAKLKAGDYIETSKGAIVKLTADDLLTLKAGSVKDYATQKQIDEFEAAKKESKKITSG